MNLLEKVKDVKREMADWYGVVLSDKTILEWADGYRWTDFDGEPCDDAKLDYFDTMERECLINFVANKLTGGMNWPCNGDSVEYKKSFYEKFNKEYDKYESKYGEY